MTTVSKFPLLQLPQKEILRTIQSIDIYQKMSFSLTSKRCKRLVQSLQIKIKCISVIISSRIYITVSFSDWTLYIRFENCIMQREARKKRLRAPQWVEADSRRLERIGFEYSDWLKHFQDIFHCPSTATISFFQGTCVYDIDDIKEGFGATKTLYARHTGCYAYNLALLQKILPIENLTINPNMFQDSKIPFKILQQNYTTLDIISDSTTEMTLNELLVMNSKTITMTDVRVSAQDLNKFIKLWIQGSNSRMEYFLIHTLNHFEYDRTMVMKGIKKSNERREDMDVHSIDIYRMDGTRATVSFFYGGIEISIVLITMLQNSN
ncbi:hypothetical protein CAEBREN_16248 [Caenorhabditis brenneri]|uniref:F-box domain-containing protein n=1 Tax=Caenorhabditis brenneri TaxID=135651 RepID=G0N0J2_CAEBE|nr:hypothetical protein CAEBREN_16248 [Caenorhabditis brenneri]